MNETEHYALLALLRLEEGSYAIPIRREIEERSGRRVSVTAIYAALDRLERRGYVESWLSEPVSERGGRARKYYRVLGRGVAALRRERGSLERMWEGVERLARQKP